MVEHNDELRQKKLDLIQMKMNQPSEHPLTSLFYTAGGILVFLIMLYGTLKLTIDTSIYLMPDTYAVSLTKSLGDVPVFKVESNKDEETRLYLQGILDRLKQNSSLHNVEVEIILKEDPTPNAFAYPGYKIVVHDGLIKGSKSENEIAFVLGHELGHFHYRHLLKGLSSSVFDFTFSVVAMVSGIDISIIQGVKAGLNLQFSQNQESESDRYALNLMNHTYDGNSSGVTDFFSRLSKDEGVIRKNLKFLFTHPLSQDRIDDLNKSVETMGMTSQGLTPLPSHVQDLGKDESEDKGSD